ncbi:hydrogenase expression/formation protein HypE [Veillonella ratti]|uniref:hydrogenase expression/formation protein HypE n=1 Tax=Veillonella ratti TaxID=103892 RepID=UPI001D0441CE|nr:hydrogenase expression/formation protein HypE [Veillonella ratti]MCB5744496.1 hydrogenase expression/formation protein HypE [Veillonella ratti]MCB5758472.1 hydrogenase expression/formation protein HypE [Veillonella ratti]MCB5760774.1 hydrogenase expression/formation protein HypE [Veillonella ratti]MCB5763067.1 hydrogenase expression/formation protein HypE [Veillonella ratti]MCB5783454.1 hydrogenase expression/formation protein HypE [Veillonella ratti]
MDETIRLVHGNGGRFSHELMEKYIMPHFKNEALAKLHDGAQFEVPAGRMAFTTDSYVVTPQFFPGGNIGKLAVCGTVNDLAMNGAKPLYLSCGLILEEGLSVKTLDSVLATMADMAKEVGVSIVTGDTKVVEKGAVDGLYINTAGVGMIPEGINIDPERVKPGMKIIVSGSLGDHAIAVMGSRYELALPPTIKTDCAPLNHMVMAVLEAVGNKVAVMRDPTRGGLATTLYEIASQANVGIRVDEHALPIHDEVQSVCSILGYDPLYLANEGKAVFVVEADVADTVLEILRANEYGREAACIGEVLSSNAGKVGLKIALGGVRLLDQLGEDQVPRIC